MSPSRHLPRIFVNLSTIVTELQSLVCRDWKRVIADQAVAVELPALTTAAHYDWLAATRIPLQSLRFCGATPAPQTVKTSLLRVCRMTHTLAHL